MGSIFPQWIQDINTGLSILGFFITIYVLIEVRHIKSAFLARARLPDLIKELSKTGSALNSDLDNWEHQKNKARSQIKVAATLIQSALAMLPKQERTAVARLQKKMLNATQHFSDEKYLTLDIAWDLYSDIQSCITTLSQVSKNMKWG